MWLSACAPVSNDILRGSGAPLAADTGGACVDVFADAFEDEDGADPPAGWTHVGSDPDPVGREADGLLTIEADVGTSRLATVEPLGVTADAPLWLGVDVRERAPGGPEATLVLSLLRSMALPHSVEVHIGGEGEVALKHRPTWEDTPVSVPLGTLGAEHPGAYVLDLWVDAEGLRLETDGGFDGGPVAWDELGEDLSREGLLPGALALQMSSLGAAGTSRVVVDAVWLRAGAPCGDAGR